MAIANLSFNLAALRTIFGGTLALLVLSAPTSIGQTWSTGFFNTGNGWQSGSFWQGQKTNDPASARWKGNDPEVGNVGGTDYVALAIGYTPAGVGNRSGIQGGLNAPDGYVPATNDVKLWRSFTPLQVGETGTISFNVEWSLVGSLIGEYPELDTFAFDLRNADNSASLIRFDLRPGIAVLSNAYTVQWIRNDAVESTVIDLGYQGLYQMQVDITGSAFDMQITQINASTRAVLTNWALIDDGLLSGSGSATNFGTVSLDWVLASGNPADPGSNYIIVNDVSVVPEPSTYALLGLSGFGLALMLRRRRNRHA